MSRSPAAKPDSEEVIVQAYAAYRQAFVASGRAPAKLAGPEQERVRPQAARQMVGVTGFEAVTTMPRT